MGDGNRIKTAAVVLAAGDGRRLKSSLPKVLHPVGGRTLLGHVLEALAALDLETIVVVASMRVEEVRAAMQAAGVDGVEYAVQDPPQGTADAVRVGLTALPPAIDRVLVAQGDSPLVTTETFRRLLEEHDRSSSAVTLVTARVEDPFGAGRIVRKDDRVERIVEEKDATEKERALDEVNAGVYVFDLQPLSEVIEKVDKENVQGEYYLTDVIQLLWTQGHSAATVEAPAPEITGVNSRAQLARVGEILRWRVAERWLDEGVTIIDPATTYIDATVTIGRDAVIRPFTFLEGATRVGEGADVGPHARVIDSVVEEGAAVSFAVVRDSSIGPEASVGPFASVRPGTRLERGARLGTFVEAKQTTLGEGSKANHLAYLGDAEIGRGVNIGAGTITCNWDGREKHRTVIEDDAYIASDTMIVAPSRIGKRAATGAGSVVRGDVPDDALAVGVPARIIEGKGDKMGKARDEDLGEPRE